MPEGWWRWTWEHWVSAAETHRSSRGCSVATSSMSSKFPGQQRDGTWDTGRGTQALAVKANLGVSSHLFCSLSHESKPSQLYLFKKLIYKEVSFLQMGRNKSSHRCNISLGSGVLQWLNPLFSDDPSPFIDYEVRALPAALVVSRSLDQDPCFPLSKVRSVGLKEIP